MSDEKTEQLCMFGWPDRPWKGRRGRPPHEPSPETTNKIKMLLAFGWVDKRIAGALGITLPTLKKHYFHLLKVREIARDALEARRAEHLWAQVEKGNVGAMNQFGKLLEANDRMRRTMKLRDGDEDDYDLPKERKPALPRVYHGKKSQAKSAAELAIASDPDLQPNLIN